MGLVLNPEITWVNPIDRVSVAEHKLYQLQIARELGFRVPRTLVSRDPLELRSFAAANRAGTICKPIFHGMFIDETSTYSVYTRRVTPESFDDAGRRQNVPCIAPGRNPEGHGCTCDFHWLEVFCGRY